MDRIREGMVTQAKFARPAHALLKSALLVVMVDAKNSEDAF